MGRPAGLITLRTPSGDAVPVPVPVFPLLTLPTLLLPFVATDTVEVVDDLVAPNNRNLVVFTEEEVLTSLTELVFDSLMLQVSTISMDIRVRRTLLLLVVAAAFVTENKLGTFEVLLVLTPLFEGVFLSV